MDGPDKKIGSDVIFFFSGFFFTHGGSAQLLFSLSIC
jgi:hypothetical protein